MWQAYKKIKYILYWFILELILVNLAYAINLHKLSACIYHASQITHLDYKLLLAIYKTESNLQPYAISVCKNGREVYSFSPTNKQEAVMIAKYFIKHGYNVDMGIGQVDSENLSSLHLSVEDIFDPCVNVYASAYILEGCIKTYGYTTKAIDCYNKGNNASYNSLYVYKVFQAYKTIP